MKEKKKTKAVILSCILMLALIFCTGCDSATSGISGLMSEESKLAGVYENEYEFGTLELAKDGTMRSYTNFTVSIAEFTAEDGIFTIKRKSISTQYDYTFEDDVLTLYTNGVGIALTRTADGEKTAGIRSDSSIVSISGMFKDIFWGRLLLEEDGTAWYYDKSDMSGTLKKGTYSIAGGHISFDIEDAISSIADLADGVNFEVDDEKLTLFSSTTSGTSWVRTTDKTYQSTLKKVKSIAKKTKKSGKETTTYSNEESYDDYSSNYGDSWYYDDGYTYDDSYEDDTYWEDEYDYYDDYGSGGTSGSISTQTNNSTQEEEQTEYWGEDEYENGDMVE